MSRQNKTSEIRSDYFNSNWKDSLDFLWLEITNRCNLSCVHCYADSNPFAPLTNKMDYNDWLAVMRDGYSSGCEKIQFIGGEPTIHPDLSKMIKAAYEIGYKFIEVYTNGTFVTEELFRTFKNYDTHVAFSLYSYHADTHEKVTTRKGSFAKTVKNIRRALDSGISIRVGIIEMKENFGDTEKTVEFVKDLGVKEIGIDSIRGIGRGTAQNNSKDPVEQLCGACWKGKLVVDSNGEVFPCIFSRFYKIGYFIEGIPTLLQKNILHNFRKNVKEMNEKRIIACDPDCSPSTCPPTRPGCNPDRCIPQGGCNPDSCNPLQICSPEYCAPEY